MLGLCSGEFKMSEMWSYDKTKRFDKKGERWHFVRRYIWGEQGDSNEQPFELYFRDDARTEFGLLRFERQKDNPYRDYDLMINKIMNDAEFRKTLLIPETEGVWNRNWK
jgi:hypothetical protein